LHVRERRLRGGAQARGARATDVRRGVASFVVRAGDARVHLAVRTDGERARIVAVCSPRMRERVERALAHARFVLAAHGIRAEAAS
jgi:hypothetical protein